MSETKKVFKWWWAWNPGKIERWLEEQERQGWNLSRISTTGLHFHFEKGPSRKIAYCIDYQSQAKADYFQLLSETGWSLVADGFGWYYWRQEYSAEKPELFSETQSLIDRNNRQLLLIMILLLAQLSIFSNIVRLFKEKTDLFHKILLILQGTEFLALLVILIVFLTANRRMRKQMQIKQWRGAGIV